MKSLISLLIISLLFLAGASCAEVPARQYPCEENKHFDEFDFWVGAWNVHGVAGKLAGSNDISKSHNGCVLIENWTSASGGTGMSINYFDHAGEEWVQIWNSGDGSQINIRGGLTADGMLLVGTIHTVGDNATQPFRGLWTELPDGRVRQFFEISTDDGATWITWFDGYYTRKAVDESSD
jgi:hypothetical protein